MKTSQDASFGMVALALETIRCHPLRSLIAILSIAVALGAAMVMVGASQAIEATLESGYASRHVDLIVLQAGKSNPMTSRVRYGLAKDIAAIDGVARVQALLADSLMLGEDRGMLVYGWPADYPELRRPDPTGSVALEHGEVLVGRTAAELGGIAPGMEIDLNLGRFRVAGVFKGESFFESGVAYMRLDDLQRLIGARDLVTFLFLELRSGATDADRAAIKQGIETLDPGVRVLTAAQFLRDNQLTGAVRGLGRIILLTNVLLSVLIVSTIMVLTVSDRRTELAVLRAIGWSARRIAWLVTLETAVLAVGAALVGVVIGWFGLRAALAYLQTQGLHAESVLTLESILWLLLASAVVAVLGAVIPVHHTMRIRVTEALRDQ